MTVTDKNIEIAKGAANNAAADGGGITIDAGSGYLCQMEPVAHYGIRKNEKNFKVEVRWTDGSREMINIKRLNQTITVKQK